MLFNIATSLTAIAHDDLDWVSQDALCEALDGARKRCREHDCLLVGSTSLKHDFDLWFKSHVQNAVCLVEHYVANSAKIGYLSI